MGGRGKNSNNRQNYSKADIMNNFSDSWSAHGGCWDSLRTYRNFASVSYMFCFVLFAPKQGQIFCQCEVMKLHWHLWKRTSLCQKHMLSVIFLQKDQTQAKCVSMKVPHPCHKRKFIEIIFTHLWTRTLLTSPSGKILLRLLAHPWFYSIINSLNIGKEVPLTPAVPSSALA